MIQHLLVPALLWFGAETPVPQPALHPATLEVFVEASDVASLLKAYEKAPVVQMLNDPGTQKIADVAKELGFDLRGMVQGMLPVVDASRAADRFWPWSAATAASMSIAELGTAKTTGAEARTIGRGWLVIDFKDVAAAEQAIQAIGASGGVEKLSIEGETSLSLGSRSLPIQRFVVPALGQVWIARDEARLIGGIGLATPQELTERLAKPETSFVEKHARVVDDTSFKSACGVTLVRAWSELERLPQGMLPEMSATDAALLNTFVPGFLPFVGQKGRYRMQLCGDRFVSESLVERIGDAKQLDDLYGTGDIPLSTARMVPKEAVGAWVMKIQPAQFEALLERTLAGMNSPAAAKPDEKAPKLSAAVGDSGAMFLLPLSIGSLNSGSAPVPPAVLSVALKDAAAFKTALDAWIERAKLADPTLKVENKPYHKLPMYTFTLGSTPDENGANAESSMKPTIAILADRVLVTPNRKTAQGEVRRTEMPITEVHALAGEGAIPKGAFEASTMDWGAAVGKLYDAGRGFLPMLSQGRETPIDVESLPTASTLFRFFKPSASYSQRIDGKTYTYSESSIGPEVPLALAMLSLGFSSSSRIGGLAATGSGPAESGAPRAAETSEQPKPAVAAEREATLKSLRSVRTGLAIYRSQFQRVPNALDELVKGTDAFPKGFLEGTEVPKDGWGRALVYSVRDNGAKYDLRSTGANGVDDQGAGDDVLLP